VWHRPITIVPSANLPRYGPVAAFASSFAAIWLYVEPLGLFGLVPPLPAAKGILLYALMIACAIVVTVVWVMLHRRYSYGRLTFITFIVASSSDGADHVVRAPTNMLVDDFLYKFLRYLESGPAGDRIRALQRQHFPVLQLNLNNAISDVPMDKTLSDAGITDGCRCLVRGERYRSPDVPMFSRGSRPAIESRKARDDPIAEK